VIEKIGDEGGVARPGNIRLSPKHGVNSSLMQCFLYGESCGVALAGLLKGDAKAPRQAEWEQTPCLKCQVAGDGDAAVGYRTGAAVW
jgi:hypothetical protein